MFSMLSYMVVIFKNDVYVKTLILLILSLTGEPRERERERLFADNHKPYYINYIQLLIICQFLHKGIFIQIPERIIIYIFLG